VWARGPTPFRGRPSRPGKPSRGLSGKEDAYDCNECGPDGYLDLTLKFDAQEVIAALGDVNDGDVLLLQLTGKLKEGFGGMPIVGQDVVWILKLAPVIEALHGVVQGEQASEAESAVQAAERQTPRVSQLLRDDWQLCQPEIALRHSHTDTVQVAQPAKSAAQP
jgi:hypothetical protein